MLKNKVKKAPIPMKFIGPIKIISDEIHNVKVPLATYETPLWSSVGRGARVTSLAGGIKTIIVDDRMTRSILLEASDASHAVHIWNHIKHRKSEMNQVVKNYSQYAKLIDMHVQIVGNMLYLRFEFTTGDASGHNMVTLASEKLQTWLQEEYENLKYCTISANYCCDKKATAVNGILGRGKHVVAEINIPRSLCQQRLRSLPETIVDLNIKKNLIGTILAGGIRSANAHFANMLLAFYLATGQDAANIIEGSQGITFAEVRQGDLYFSVTLPNLIIGTIGNGKGLDFVLENLKLLGCTENSEAGVNACKLALICAATVLCGELSLMAAQTNEGELMRSHLRLERK